MKLENLTGEFENHKVLMYAKDGNTVVRHNKPMRKIAENIYAGMCNDSNWDNACNIYIVFDDVKYGIMMWAVPNDTETENIIRKISSTKYNCKEGWIETVQQSIADEEFIKMLLVEFVGQFKPELVPDMMKAREVFNEKRDQKRAEERAQEEAENAEFVRAENEKTEKMISDALDVLKNGGKLENDTITVYRSRYDSSSYSIVNYLFRKYGVDCPIKTQGWVNNSLRSLSIKDGKCYGLQRITHNKQSKCSQKIFECVNQLIAAVNAA